MPTPCPKAGTTVRVAVVDAFSRIVRLGEGLEARGCLSREAMDRTIDALRICAGKIRRHRPMAARVVATEACRRAKNGGYFLERARRETGLCVETISAREEARLALAGCAALIDRAVPHALVFDIGGGSTELLWLDVPAQGPLVIRAVLSVQAGVVALADRFGPAAETLEGYRAMRASVECALAGFEAAHGVRRYIAEGAVQMVGASGTVTTLAGIHMGLPRYDRTLVDGAELPFAAIAEVSAAILAMDPAGRHGHPCIGRARADLVVAGCAILDAICGLWPVGRLTVADRGVREGILLGLMGVPAPIAFEACRPERVVQGEAP
jgi:exopolyphosphatase / guanosine-5'-triphosphate,3'-diphosphate pyrophosphatase